MYLPFKTLNLKKKISNKCVLFWSLNILLAKINHVAENSFLYSEQI